MGFDSAIGGVVGPLKAVAGDGGSGSGYKVTLGAGCGSDDFSRRRISRRSRSEISRELVNVPPVANPQIAAGDEAPTSRASELSHPPFDSLGPSQLMALRSARSWIFLVDSVPFSRPIWSSILATLATLVLSSLEEAAVSGSRATAVAAGFTIECGAKCSVCSFEGVGVTPESLFAALPSLPPPPPTPVPTSVLRTPEMVGVITLGFVGVTILGCLTDVAELAAGDVSGVPALFPAGLLQTAEFDVGAYGTSTHASRARMRTHAAHHNCSHEAPALCTVPLPALVDSASRQSKHLKACL